MSDWLKICQPWKIAYPSWFDGSDQKRGEWLARFFRSFDDGRARGTFDHAYMVKVKH